MNETSLIIFLTLFNRYHKIKKERSTAIRILDYLLKKLSSTTLFHGQNKDNDHVEYTIFQNY